MQGNFAHAKIQKTNHNTIDIFPSIARAASCSTAIANDHTAPVNPVTAHNICVGAMYALSLIGYETPKT